MTRKVYAPNLHLFAFHLKESDRPELLWDKYNFILSKKFGLTKPLEIKEQIGYRVDLLKDKTKDDVALHFESKVSLDGTPLPITGLATPIRIDDTYTLALNIRRPELDENRKKTKLLNPNFLELLNPSGCLMPTEIGSSLGQTLLLTVWYTEEKQWLPWKSLQNRQQLRELADNCLREFIPNEYFCPDFYREGQLFGSPIFEYGTPIQGKDYCHVLVWIFCETDTDKKFTDHYSSFVNLFCYLNRVITVYQRSRKVHNVFFDKHLAIDPYLEKIFRGMPVDKDPTRKESTQFKKYSKEIAQKSLSYRQLTRNLDNYCQIIDIYAQSYKLELNYIQSQLPGENFSFLSQFFDQDCRFFEKQLQSDLGYFQHGAALLKKVGIEIYGIEQLLHEKDNRIYNLENMIVTALQRPSYTNNQIQEVTQMTNNTGGFSVGGSVGGDISNLQGDNNRAIQGDNNQDVLGDNNQVTQTQGNASTEEALTKEQVIQLLAELDNLVRDAEIPEDTKEEATMYLGAAKKATEKEDPKKKTILTNLESVAETLETAGKTVDAGKSLWDKAKPIILKVAGWLGAAASFHLLGL